VTTLNRQEEGEDDSSLRPCGHGAAATVRA
jgi:hypothetical protein